MIGVEYQIFDTNSLLGGLRLSFEPRLFLKCRAPLTCTVLFSCWGIKDYKLQTTYSFCWSKYFYKSSGVSRLQTANYKLHSHFVDKYLHRSQEEEMSRLQSICSFTYFREFDQNIPIRVCRWCQDYKLQTTISFCWLKIFL